jgi:hypothetical protein
MGFRSIPTSRLFFSTGNSVPEGGRPMLQKLTKREVLADYSKISATYGVVLGIMWRKVLIDKWRKSNPNNSEAQEFPTITVEGYVSHEHALRAGN